MDIQLTSSSSCHGGNRDSECDAPHACFSFSTVDAKMFIMYCMYVCISRPSSLSLFRVQQEEAEEEEERQQ